MKRPPQRQTRQRVERDRASARDKSGAKRRKAANVEQHLAKLRDNLDLAAFAQVEAQFRDSVRRVSVQVRGKRRRPGQGSMPALVEPPRGPKPLSGGAAAPLEFD